MAYKFGYSLFCSYFCTCNIPCRQTVILIEYNMRHDLKKLIINEKNYDPLTLFA